MMRAASREALREFEPRVDAVGQSAGVESLSGLADDLYAVAAVLAGQPRLRRLLSDPARDPQSRAGLIDRLFNGKVRDEARELARLAVSLRWSRAWDLADSIELAGDRLLLDQAEQQGRLVGVEDELFRFSRILDGDDRLRSLLDEQVVPGERRVRLLHGVLDGRADAVTIHLLDHAIRSGRKRSIVLAIDDLLEEAATRRNHSTAIVRTARPLTAAQRERLSSTLAGVYGRQIDVREEIDPSVLGGLVVRVGHEIIDGSVSGRLGAVRQALAG
jgi:F-type H+-transporting ATPase subunit delta